ncbi:hypothetical protein [Methanobrevibacter sp.]|uniref:hypothetical protein n=1 Tax=Methanobrevibacter sp. TaxID=66852 RepID=UPI00386E11D0
MTQEDEKNTDKNTKKSTKKNTESKKTLVELVEESEVSIISIIMDLSQNGLLDQYREELSLKEQGIPIIPSITEAEFKKIIGDK